MHMYITDMIHNNRATFFLIDTEKYPVSKYKRNIFLSNYQFTCLFYQHLFYIVSPKYPDTSLHICRWSEIKIKDSKFEETKRRNWLN